MNPFRRISTIVGPIRTHTNIYLFRHISTISGPVQKLRSYSTIISSYIFHNVQKILYPFSCYRLYSSNGQKKKELDYIGLILCGLELDKEHKEVKENKEGEKEVEEHKEEVSDEENEDD